MLYLQAKKSICQQVFKQAKKLMVISATSISMTERKTKEELKSISCIWYFVIFKDQIKALLDSKSEINIMNQTFAS